MFQTSADTPTLCRHRGKTCGACCWGAAVDRATLQLQLERNRQLFQRIVGARRFLQVRLWWHEVRSHHGSNVWWGLLLWIPKVRDLVKRHLSRHLVCPFLSFESAQQREVGCMLHPAHRPGPDIRNKVAFRGLRGIECGDRDYVCRGCRQYDGFEEPHRVVFDTAISDLDWYDYTNTVRAFSCGIAGATPSRPSDEPKSTSGANVGSDDS